MNAPLPFPRRRRLLAAGALLTLTVTPVFAAVPELADAIAAHTGGAKVTAGRVLLDIAQIVENGNTVPVTITLDSPMNANERVVSLALFNEKNPQREVIKAVLGPRAGRAMLATRIRLATSQKLVALAQMSDGRWYSHTAEVVVALAACVEGTD